MELIEKVITPLTNRQIDLAIKYATEDCAKYGLTMIHDAGVQAQTIERYKIAIDRNRFDLRIYAMLQGDLSYGGPSQFCDYKKLDRFFFFFLQFLLLIFFFFF